MLVLHFDEGSGTIAKDESGHGNDGTIYGAPWTTGISGKALSFDGNGDYVSVSNAPHLNPNSEITIEAWIYPSGVGSDSFGIVGKVDTPAHNGYILGRFRTTNKMRFYPAGDYGGPKGAGADNNRFVSTVTDIPLNKWTHYAATFDGSTIKMFVNGVQENTFSYSGDIWETSQPLVIGRWYSNYNGYYYNGIIDEVAIYSKALTPEEIQAHYDAKRVGSPTTALSVKKDASTYSIKQEQKTTVKITVENTGTTTIKDIEVVDTLPADFDFVSGDTSAKYDSLKPRESRTFQYTLRSGDTGKFDLCQATATYADDEGNYHTVESNSPLVEVMAPLEKPEIPTGEEGEKKGIPGFEAAFAIVGLLAVAYLIRRRKVK